MAKITASTISNEITAVSDIMSGLAVFTNLESQAQLWGQLFYKNLNKGTNQLLDGAFDDMEVIVYNNRKGMTIRFDNLWYEPADGSEDDALPASIVIEFQEKPATVGTLKTSQFLCSSIVMGYKKADNAPLTVLYSKPTMLTKLADFYDLITKVFMQI